MRSSVEGGLIAAVSKAQHGRAQIEALLCVVSCARAARSDFSRRCSGLAGEKAELVGIIEKLEADLVSAKADLSKAEATRGSTESETAAELKRLRQELVDSGLPLIIAQRLANRRLLFHLPWS